MKKVLLGSIPILAVLVLAMNFLGEGIVRVQAVNDIRAQANTFPSDENLNWARSGSLITITVFDNALSDTGVLPTTAQLAAQGFPGARNGNRVGRVDFIQVTAESDEADTSITFRLAEVTCTQFPCATRPLLNGATPNGADFGADGILGTADDAGPDLILGTGDDVSVYKTGGFLTRDAPGSEDNVLTVNFDTATGQTPNGENVSGDSGINQDFFLGTFLVRQTVTVAERTQNANNPFLAPRPVLLVDDEDVIDINWKFTTASFDIENDAPDTDSLEPDDEDVVDDNEIDVMFEMTDADSMFIAPDDLNAVGIQQENFSVILISDVQCGNWDGVDGRGVGTEGIFTVNSFNTANANRHNPVQPFINTILDLALGPDLDRNGERFNNVMLTESEFGLDLDADGNIENVAQPFFERGLRDVDCDADGDEDVQVIFPNVDDDYNEINEGFEVERAVNTSTGDQVYIGIAIVDNSGNFDLFDAESGRAQVVFNEVTVDEDDPEIDVIRTGVNFDGTDNEYEQDQDDERDWIQVLFTQLTELDGDSIDADDFVVEGHDVRRAVWYDVDPEDLNGGPGSNNPGVPEDVNGEPFLCAQVDIANQVPISCDPAIAGLPAGDIEIPDPDDAGDTFEINKFAFVKRAVFLQLEDELDADEEEFDINIVPDGVDDEAGNTQDSTDDEAQDWIPPRFQVLEMTSPRPQDEDGNLIAGEDDELELIITSDEDLEDDPTVEVFFIQCEDFDTPVRCPSDNGANPGAFHVAGDEGDLNADVDEIGRNRWRVEIDEPTETGYYSIFIFGTDDSRQDNIGNTGIAPEDLADTGDRGFWENNGDVNDNDAIFFEGDILLPNPQVLVGGDNAEESPDVEFRNPFFIELDFTEPFDPTAGINADPEDRLTEDDEYNEDNFSIVEVILFELDGVDLTDQVTTTDDETFLIAVENIAIGDHEITINARDMAGNELEEELDLDFEVKARDPFELELNPGWNLFSVPGDPDSPAIGDVFGPGTPVTTIYTFDPTVPGGWLVAVRDTPDDDWVGDLTTISDENGYWGLASQIVKIDVDVPRLAGGAVNGGTPIQPPALDLFPGWNLIPVVDVTGEADFDDAIDADVYFSSAANEQGGVSISRILTFNTITNEWEVIPFFPNAINSDGLDLTLNTRPQDPAGVGNANFDDPDIFFGTALWVFAIEGFTLVPGGDLLIDDPDN